MPVRKPTPRGRGGTRSRWRRLGLTAARHALAPAVRSAVEGDDQGVESSALVMNRGAASRAVGERGVRWGARGRRASAARSAGPHRQARVAAKPRLSHVKKISPTGMTVRVMTHARVGQRLRLCHWRAGLQRVDAIIGGGGHRSGSGVSCAAPSGAPGARQLANPSGFLCRRPSPFIRLSRAGAATHHQVGRPVLAGGPIHDRVDDLTGNTRASRSGATTSRSAQPTSLRRAVRYDTDHLRWFRARRINGT